MEPERKMRALYILGFVLAVWFLLTSWVWVYYANVFFSFPAGIAAYLIFRYMKKHTGKEERIAKIILVVGLSSSAISLLLLLISN